jgi:hypothetical protein
MVLGRAAHDVIHGFILAQNHQHDSRFHHSRTGRAAAQGPASLNDKLSTKLRWNLTADEAELAALSEAAGACPDRTVMYDPAP